VGRRDKVFDAATADAATDSNIINVIDYVDKLIYIKCNHASKDIQYRIMVYADSRDTGDSGHVLLGWRKLGFGETTIHKTTDAWDQIYLQFKNDSAGNNSSAVAWINCVRYSRG